MIAVNSLITCIDDLSSRLYDFLRDNLPLGEYLGHLDGSGTCPRDVDIVTECDFSQQSLNVKAKLGQGERIVVADQACAGELPWWKMRLLVSRRGKDRGDRLLNERRVEAGLRADPNHFRRTATLNQPMD